MYHTAERRAVRLSSPTFCNDEDAWLGDGHYFWDDIVDAEKWGNDRKRKTGYYEIYSAKVNCEKVLDTVFNEEHYRFWVNQVEKAAKKIVQKTGNKPTL